MGYRQSLASHPHVTAQPHVAVRPDVAVWPDVKAHPHIAAQPHITVRPHISVRPHVAAQRHVQDAEAGDDERSDESSETRLQSNDDILVTWPEVPTVPVFEEADKEEEVVPETEYSYQVIVFQTQSEVDEIVVPPDVVTGSTYGGSQLPTESEVDAYSSYSQFSSQFSDQGPTCSHCGNKMTTTRFSICTYGNDHTCADCNEEWLGN
jgi:hypothetical protein